MHTNSRFYKAVVLLLFVTVYRATAVFAGQADTVTTFSPSMKKNIKAVVISPDSYRTGSKRYPVVYLLHGYGSNYASFIKAIPELKTYADTYQVMLVCPDGNVGSWYFDSPVDPSWKYDTYVSDELIKWMDSRYRTIATKKGRGITGFSMGGHGAMYLSFRHQEVYGVAGSMSGGVDFRPFPTQWEIAKRLGTLQEFPDRWNQYTVINMIPSLKPGALELIIDCGTGDFFYMVNNAFHDKLLSNGIAHDFVIRPGRHDWPYWRNSINYQLLFMSNYFTR